MLEGTGSRRYWIIESPQKEGEQINVDLVVEERDRIWKTSLLDYGSGMKQMIYYELEKKSILQNKHYLLENPFVPAISKSTRTVS